MSIAPALSSQTEDARVRRLRRMQRQPKSHCAFSLIEIIGVLAIMALLAAATLPVLTRQIDFANQGMEATNLVALAAGLTQGASAQRYIPGQANWDSFIAANIGWQLAAVQTNSRNNARAFLIDPSLQIVTGTTTSLPYQQTSSGANSVTNARLIIVSSLFSPLPALSSADFNALWTNTVDTIPTGSSSFNNWKGQGADIKIQRMNLGSSFNHLVLTVSDPTSASYSIDSQLGTVSRGAPLDAYFLNGTVLNLYYGTNLQASQVLQQDTSWFYCNGLWRNAPCPSANAGLNLMVQIFATNAPTTTVYADMTNYMSLYLQYSAGGFKNPSSVQAALVLAATKLNTDIGALLPP
jgi:type II secretory pathway pseudopilin PulG